MLVQPHQEFGPSPFDREELPLAQFIPSKPAMAPAFMPREDLRKVNLEKTDPSKTTYVGKSLRHA